jgi:hypothetical protein
MFMDQGIGKHGLRAIGEPLQNRNREWSRIAALPDTFNG